MGTARFLVLALGFALATPPSASATCFNQCWVMMVDASCEEIASGSAVAVVPFFQFDCQTCCSPPGGPVNCSALDPLDTQLSLVDSGTVEPNDGTFAMNGDTCGDAPNWAFYPSTPLDIGDYQVLTDNLIVVEFTLMGCSADEDCPGAGICLDGTCSDTVGCASDEDCGSCQACFAGQCFGLGVSQCQLDADCPPGETCDVDPDDACQNACVGGGSDGSDGAGECATDQDCGSCAICGNGFCFPTGTFTCVSDPDCPDGLACQTDSDACSSQCVPSGTDGGDGFDGTDDGLFICFNDEDCEPCFECNAGECAGTGLVICNVDSDCGPKHECAVNSSNPCANQCVALASDGTDGGDGSSDAADARDGADGRDGADTERDGSDAENGSDGTGQADSDDGRDGADSADGADGADGTDGASSDESDAADAADSTDANDATEGTDGDSSGGSGKKKKAASCTTDSGRNPGAITWLTPAVLALLWARTRRRVTTRS